MARSNISDKRKEISAWLIGCEPGEVLGFRDYGEDGVAAIGPDGKKYIFTVQQLDKGKAAMELDQAAEATAKAEASPEPSTRAMPEEKPEPPAKKKATTRRKKTK